jgi:hypothetical protein
MKEIFKIRRPASGLRGVRLLHDNAFSSMLVRDYLGLENVVELPYSPYAPDFSQ